MKRERRYIVLKIKDIEAADFSAEELNVFNSYCDRIADTRLNAGKSPLYCVVVESDWPEYEPVWKMIEDRVDKENKEAQ